MLSPEEVGALEIAISHRASPEERSVHEGILAALGELRYLQDLAPEERAQAARRADVLLGWNPALELGEAVCREMGALRMVQLISAGADHLDPRMFPEEAILCSNAGAFAQPMAEHVLAMALALAKRLVQGHEELRRGIIDQRTPSRSLRGATVGVVGYGGIGRAVGETFRALGCEILAINRGGRVEDPVAFHGTLRDLPEVLSRSDIVVFCLALTPRTRGLVGRRELSLLREESILINVARAAIWDEDAVYEHLREHPKVLAGIDVWWEEPFRRQAFHVRHPFLDLPNVLGSPHNSGVAQGAVIGAVERACRNVARGIRGEAPEGVLRREELFAS